MSSAMKLPHENCHTMYLWSGEEFQTNFGIRTVRGTILGIQHDKIPIR